MKFEKLTVVISHRVQKSKQIRSQIIFTASGSSKKTTLTALRCSQQETEAVNCRHFLKHLIRLLDKLGFFDHLSLQFKILICRLPVTIFTRLFSNFFQGTCIKQSIL